MSVRIEDTATPNLKAYARRVEHLAEATIKAWTLEASHLADERVGVDTGDLRRSRQVDFDREGGAFLGIVRSGTTPATGEYALFHEAMNPYMSDALDAVTAPLMRDMANVLRADAKSFL